MHMLSGREAALHCEEMIGEEELNLPASYCVHLKGFGFFFALSGTCAGTCKPELKKTKHWGLSCIRDKVLSM